MIASITQGSEGEPLPSAVRAITATDSVTQKVFTAAEYPAMRPITPWIMPRCARRIWRRCGVVSLAIRFSCPQLFRKTSIILPRPR
jgi:hypothetical protein